MLTFTGVMLGKGFNLWEYLSVYVFRRFRVLPFPVQTLQSAKIKGVQI